MSDLGSVGAAQFECEVNAGNDVTSCYPVAETIALQDEFAAFVWNSNLPDLVQAGFVDIQLFHADSRQQVFNFSHVANPSGIAGTVSVPVNDSWWGDAGGSWAGTNISHPFFWVITRADEPNGGRPQATFTAVSHRRPWPNPSVRHKLYHPQPVALVPPIHQVNQPVQGCLAVTPRKCLRYVRLSSGE
ncbi:hypothetical protein MVEN_01959000 [Mycena venus]|uniref:Uncharacterized protein n=1 Tax=Mycena venus TaxID=2733690 RepID=A0A8H6XFB5_9AGAR|nr:hypothetical protein MVEN_01959000 [Mycena venus]